MRHSHAYGHGMAVPNFFPHKLRFLILHGLNALEFGLNASLLVRYELWKWLEMEVNGVEE